MQASAAPCFRNRRRLACLKSFSSPLLFELISTSSRLHLDSMRIEPGAPAPNQLLVLKNVLHCELQDSGSAARRVGPNVIGDSREDLTKSRVIPVHVRVCELRSIGHVEGFHSDLQLLAFANFERSANRLIPFPEAGASYAAHT